MEIKRAGLLRSDASRLAAAHSQEGGGSEREEQPVPAA